MPKVKAHSKGLPIVNERAAAIDIGSRFHVVAVGPDRCAEPVPTFQAFTSDIQRMANWLTEVGIQTVAMESTGVYWVPVYEILENHGLEVVLVNARQARAVPGRKRDVSDAQWLQRLIRRKFLSGHLNAQEWLNEDDIQQVLEATGMQGKVRVQALWAWPKDLEDLAKSGALGEGGGADTLDDIATLGSAFHFIRLDHAGSIEAYIAPLLLNLNRNHWIYGTLEVDPGEQLLKINVTDSYVQNEGSEEVETLQDKLRQALGYKDSVDGHEAFPGYGLEINIVGDGTQKDAYSCGYRALYGLYTHPLVQTLFNENANAWQFARCLDIYGPDISESRKAHTKFL